MKVRFFTRLQLLILNGAIQSREDHLIGRQEIEEQNQTMDGLFAGITDASIEGNLAVDAPAVAFQDLYVRRFFLLFRPGKRENQDGCEDDRAFHALAVYHRPAL